MSNLSAKPVSWVTAAAVFGLFALFLLLIYFAYLPNRTNAAAYLQAAEKLPEGEQWRASHDSRKAVLADMNSKAREQATSYGWVDQSKGVVRLPLDRAMALTVQEINAAKAAPAKK